MTTRTELIARLRQEVEDSTYPPTDEPEAMMLEAANMLEADAKLREAARLALDALRKKNGKWGQGHDELEVKAIATLKKALE
jgi:hypothetical protein